MILLPVERLLRDSLLHILHILNSLGCVVELLGECVGISSCLCRELNILSRGRTGEKNCTARSGDLKDCGLKINIKIKN